MSLIIKPTLAVVGAGKVGTTLARLLWVRGYVVETVYSRRFSHADALAQGVNAQAVATPDELRGDLLLITVPDDAIRATAAGLAGFNGRAAVHTSGVHDADALATLAAAGVQVGSLHPAFPFAEVERSINGLPGATFAVEAQDEPLLGWLRDVVSVLDGQVLMVPAGGKVLYHAALALLSNYTVTLYALAERLLLGIGAEKSAVNGALNGLLAGTVENLRTQGIPAALTGALARGDAGTVEAHVQALNVVDPALADLYVQLAIQTMPLLRARGMAATEIQLIERLFERHSTGV